jgi:Na+/H+ antiporter NhaC
MTNSPSQRGLLTSQILLVFLLIVWGLSPSSNGDPGLRTVLPPVLAVILALTTRQVLPSLFASVFLGATMLAGGNPLQGFLSSTAHYAVEAIADKDHAAIILFSMALSGMVGIMSRSGGSQGIVEKLSPLASTPVRAQIATWFMGLVIFFDDYANSLLVGNTMRPLTDRMRISREKLAFIVDATAAPVAGLAAISTWVGFEVGLIQDAFQELGRPESAYVIFLQTIPLRFYSIFCLVFVLAVCLSGRDFGPMLAAEVAARKGDQGIGEAIKIEQNPALEAKKDQPHRWQYAVLPVLLIFFGTASGLWLSGLDSLETKFQDQVRVEFQTRAREKFLEEASNGPLGMVPPVSTKSKKISPETLKREVDLRLEKAGINEVLSEASTSRVLIFVSFAGTLLALVLPLLGGVLSLEEGLLAWTEGAKSMIEALMILVLAWSLSHVCKDLGTAKTIADGLRSVLNPMLLPALTFMASAVISFATGSSWGTMSILMPMSIPLAVRLAAPVAIAAGPSGGDAFLAAEAPILLGTIAAILAGSCFGDHCSPISDTTILSSMASGCNHVEHVRTQMPYALVPGAAAILLGHIPAAYGVPLPLCVALGILSCVAVILLVGQSPDQLATEGCARAKPKRRKKKVRRG